MHERLQVTGARLAQALYDVHATCVAAQQLAASSGDDVPGGHGGALLDAHSALARGATLAAQAGEAVMLAVVALRDERHDEAGRLCEAAARAADQAAEQVRRARDLVAHS